MGIVVFSHVDLRPEETHAKKKSRGNLPRGIEERAGISVAQLRGTA